MLQQDLVQELYIGEASGHFISTGAIAGPAQGASIYTRRDIDLYEFQTPTREGQHGDPERTVPPVL